MTPIFWNTIYENRLKNPYILIQKYEKYRISVSCLLVPLFKIQTRTAI
uniref:Uncharacterized protein n=1 Tax=Anguilla anguilla TaxID=7936 RepID=A0A0E9WG51_ANGAN